jgi:hypothetical protein
MPNNLLGRKAYFLAANIGALLIVLAGSVGIVRADENGASPSDKKASDEHQAQLEAGLSKMLSGATLEGSFTSSGPGGDPTKLSREKYTLGEVKKIAGDVWQFPARIEYGGKDITLPIPLPIRWAGDTPVVVVDQVDLPGFGSVSARVMFFDGHYAGYWKHGAHSGNLFGEIHPAEKPTPTAQPKSTQAGSPAGKQ